MGFKRPFIVAILIVVSSVIGYVGVYYLNIPHLTWLIIGITYLVFWSGDGGVYLHSSGVYVFLADVNEV